MRDRDLDQIAHDLLDVAADIADLGEFGRLDLEERRAGELGQPARDLGLAEPVGPIIRMFFGSTSSRSSSAAAAGASGCAARWRRRAWRRSGRR
jgi:hypothetical protein